MYAVPIPCILQPCSKLLGFSNGLLSFLFQILQENGYHMLFLSARSISQAYHTRQFLFNLKQVMIKLSLVLNLKNEKRKEMRWNEKSTDWIFIIFYYFCMCRMGKFCQMVLFLFPLMDSFPPYIGKVTNLLIFRFCFFSMFPFLTCKRVVYVYCTR